MGKHREQGAPRKRADVLAVILKSERWHQQQSLWVLSLGPQLSHNTPWRGGESSFFKEKSQKQRHGGKGSG